MVPIAARTAAETDANLDVHPGAKYLLALAGHKALELLDQDADLASRTEWRGHAAAGAILVRPDGRLLQIHHRALDKWLSPAATSKHKTAP